MSNSEQPEVRGPVANSIYALNGKSLRIDFWRPTLYFFILTLLFFREPLLFPLHFHIPYDLDGYHYPLSHFIAWSLRTFHQFPWWNPFSYMGQPFFGNTQAAMFYPPTLLAVFLGNTLLGGLPYYLLELQLALHVLIAGLGAYVLIRSFRTGLWPALAGGTIYSLGAFFASHTQHLGVISAAAWLPWFLAALARLVTRRDLKSSAFAGLSLALMIFSGFPAGYLPAFIFGPLLYFFWMWQRHPTFELKYHARALALLLTAVFLGMLTSAVSWLPAYQISKQSAATLRPMAQATDGIPLEAATSFFWPNLFGQLGSNSRIAGNPTFLHLYQGIPALLLLFGAARWLVSSRVAQPFLAAWLLALFWMFGTTYFVSEIIYLLFPYFARRGIYPQYVLADFCLCTAVLAALSLDAYEKGEREKLFSHKPLAWAALLCLVLALLMAAFGSFTTQAASSAAASATLLWVALALAACGWLASQTARPALARTQLCLILSLLIAIDLIVVGSSTRLNTTPSRRGDPPPAAKFLRERLGTNSLYRADTTGVSDQWQTAILEWQIPSANGMDPLLLLKTQAYREPFSRVNGRQFSLISVQTPLLDLAGIRYIVTRADHLGDFQCVYHGEVNVFENPRALPRFFLVGAAVPASDASAAVRLIDSGQVNPARVVVVGASDMRFFAGRSVPANTSELGNINLLLYSPNQLLLRVETSRPAVLVAAETFWKDWRATVDGTPQPIAEADGIFRAVALPPGVHQVRMFIVPVILYIGGALSVSGILIILLLCFTSISQAAVNPD